MRNRRTDTGRILLSRKSFRVCPAVTEDAAVIGAFSMGQEDGGKFLIFAASALCGSVSGGGRMPWLCVAGECGSVSGGEHMSSCAVRLRTMPYFLPCGR